MNKLKSILIKYKFRILSKKGFNSNEVFKRFLRGKFSIEQTKNNLLKSFAWSVNKYITNLYVLTIINLANSLESDYDSIFYKHIRKIIKQSNKDNIYNTFEQRLKGAVEKSYTSRNTIKFNDYVKYKFREIVIDVISMYELSKENTSWTEKDFDDKNNELNNKYKDLSFKQILATIVDVNKIYINKVPEMDENDFNFIAQYIINLNTINPKFSINDITDYHNFINAYRNGALYLTLDTRSLKNYEKLFANNSNLLAYIDKCKQESANLTKKTTK